LYHNFSPEAIDFSICVCLSQQIFNSAATYKSLLAHSHGAIRYYVDVRLQ